VYVSGLSRTLEGVRCCHDLWTRGSMDKKTIYGKSSLHAWSFHFLLLYMKASLLRELEGIKRAFSPFLQADLLRTKVQVVNDLIHLVGGVEFKEYTLSHADTLYRQNVNIHTPNRIK
jgi:hypothetical protein